ncbi:MAG: IS982 family transposase, partial [Flavisolibacter sp.]|nr:IS982 family transposase [Flavisolibacter sp.]
IDDILKDIGHSEPGERKVSDSEVITTAVAAALHFKGNQLSALGYVRSHKNVSFV